MGVDNQPKIQKNLAMLADWLRVMYPDFSLQLLVVGGAALTLMGHRAKTRDVDILYPSPLPPEIREGVKAVAVARGLGPDWLNDHVANVVRELFRVNHAKVPESFFEPSAIVDVVGNLEWALASRQTLITLKLLAASPGVAKHILDLRELSPSLSEFGEAVAICLSVDNTEIRKSDLRSISFSLGFSDDDILGAN